MAKSPYELNVYTMYDVVAQLSTPLLFDRNHKSALRNFGKALPSEDQKNVIDIELYHIGSYNMETMEFTPIKPEKVVPNIEIAGQDDDTIIEMDRSQYGS